MQDRLRLGNRKDKYIKPIIPDDITTFDQFKSYINTNGFYADIDSNNALDGDDVGVSQVGTALNKANLLSDDTAALYEGLPSDPTPDDVFANIKGIVWPIANGGTGMGGGTSETLSPTSGSLSGTILLRKWGKVVSFIAHLTVLNAIFGDTQRSPIRLGSEYATPSTFTEYVGDAIVQYNSVASGGTESGRIYISAKEGATIAAGTQIELHTTWLLG